MKLKKTFVQQKKMEENLSNYISSRELRIDI